MDRLNLTTLSILCMNIVIWGLCLPRSGNLYEITLDGKAPIQYLLEGIKIGDKIFEWKEVVQTSIMVSFVHLPAYIEHEEIENT